MLITIAGLLPEPELAEVRTDLTALTWGDGAETAGHVAGAVKENSQADLSSRIGASLRERLKKAITTHSVLRAAAQPRQFSKLLISRTQTGGGYGLHVDNPFMGDGAAQLRTDLSFTLFLSDPEDYDGGELSIEHVGLTQRLKPLAGDLVLYPSTSLHEVRPVTRGTRFACVGWIESAVRAPEDREILFELENLRASLSGRLDPQSLDMLTLSKALANLKRRFA